MAEDAVISTEPGFGHNNPPLEDRIFADPDVTEAAVLRIVVDRLKRTSAEAVAAATARAKQLAANGKRIPDALDDRTALAALELLAAIDLHAQRVDDAKAVMVEALKAAADEAAKLCKPMEAGVAPLEKTLRPLFVTYLTTKLDEHNAARTAGEPKMPSYTLRGPSGSKATLTDAQKTVVTDPAAVPREFCSPDQTLIEAALAEGRQVPGTGLERSPTLRVTK